MPRPQSGTRRYGRWLFAALALAIPLAPLGSVSAHAAFLRGSAHRAAAGINDAAPQPADNLGYTRNCGALARLRGPYFHNNTYTAEPSIDVLIVSGLKHLLFTSQQGSVNVQNAYLVTCGLVNNISTVVTIQGTASGASGIYGYGDIVTTTLAHAGAGTIVETTDIWDAAMTVHKGHSTGSYNAGSSYLTTTS